MKNYAELAKIISDLNLEATYDEPMAKHTSFKIGGNADVFLKVRTLSTLKDLLEALKAQKIPHFILGNGSNLLVSDSGIRGVVIKLVGDFQKIELIGEDIIECGAGVHLIKLCRFAQQNALSGLEFAYGIPATVGGAVFMNAGAYDGEMKDVLLSTENLAPSGKQITLAASELDLSYRHSRYSVTGDIILSARLKLNRGNAAQIKEKMDGFLARRREKQPLKYPNAGSVFKRPPGNYAGTLIQTCGLKGKKIGGAEVSTKHAGFIVNTGGATCRDVLRLISHIQATVLEKADVALESEVRVVGDFS